jgi:hypothetical protein
MTMIPDNYLNLKPSSEREERGAKHSTFAELWKPWILDNSEINMDDPRPSNITLRHIQWLMDVMWMSMNDFCCFQFLMISHSDQKWQLDITFSQLLTLSFGVKLSSYNSWSLWFADSEVWTQNHKDIHHKSAKNHSLVINRFSPYSPHRLQSLKPQTPNTKESASHHYSLSWASVRKQVKLYESPQQ